MFPDAKDSREWFVYALVDPEDGLTRYVGCTVNVASRLKNHVGEPFTESRYCNLKKQAWVRSLVRRGKTPAVEVLESGFGVGWREIEKRWIKQKRDAGAPLVNGDQNFRKPGDLRTCSRCGATYGWHRIENELHRGYLCPELTIQDFIEKAS